MAKGIGLIGNFKGKVGNTVGYKLSASNTGSTQGIRIYQPIVKNPKTSAQAEQRAKLAPINATYRALKMVIDRGNEGLPYGNKSRLAWLKQTFKATAMPWFVKGATPNFPVICQLTKGSLSGINAVPEDDYLTIDCDGVTTSSPVNTIGAVSTLLMAAYPFLKDGDQITFVAVEGAGDALPSSIRSIVLNTTSTEATTMFAAAADKLHITMDVAVIAAAVIVSREGANGEHLRSSSTLILKTSHIGQAPYDATSKAAAIESYQNAAGSNADWAEESIQ